MKKLKIALYIPWIYQKGGVERTFLEIIKRSAHDWTIFTHRYEPAGTFEGFSKLKVIKVGKVPLKRGFFELASASVSMIKDKLDISGFDVFIVSTAGFAEFVALRNSSIPTIAFCHTPIRVIHDPVIRKKYLDDNVRKPLTIAKYRFFEKAYVLAEKQAWKKFLFTVVASHEVAGRLENAGICPKEKIEYLRYGVDTKRCIGKKPEKFFFLPGRISWTKNVDLGIDAFEMMVRKYPQYRDYSLVVAGGVDEKSKKFFSELVGKYHDKRIIIVKNPTDLEFNDYYARCCAVLFTAINEDWGLVPIEGMAYGKPVIAANQGGPRESIVDGKTGYLAMPTAVDFCERMAQIAGDPKHAAKMGAAGRKRAMEFDWKNSAKRMDALSEKAYTIGKK